MSSSFDLDRAGLDAALTVVLGLGVAEAVAYADRLAALVVRQRRAEAMTLNPTGVPGAPRSEDPLRETVIGGGDVVPRMTQRKLRLLDLETGVLDHATAHTVEARALPRAARLTPNEFETELRRLVTALAPVAVKDARDAPVEARRGSSGPEAHRPRRTRGTAPQQEPEER